MKQRTSKWLLIYPFLFAVHTVLHVYATNLGEAKVSDLARPLVVVVALATAALLIAVPLFRNLPKARIFASALIVAVLSLQYGIVAVERIAGKLIRVSVLPYLTPAATAAGAAAALLILLILLMRTKRQMAAVEGFLCILSCMLVIFPVAQILNYTYSAHLAKSTWAASLERERTRARTFVRPSPLPNIYYIILDSYPGLDGLKSQFGYDNSDFVSQLEKIGFAVPRHSRANYYRTAYSLCASLNYDYIDATSRAAHFSTDKEPSLRISNNRISWVLRELGYQCVFIPSGWNLTSSSPCVDTVLPKGGPGVSELERIILQQSVVGPWSENESDIGTRDYVLKQFSALSSTPGFRKPTFVFAHIMTPHQPIVFDRNGHYPGPDAKSDEMFIGQVEYVNKIVLKTVHDILAKSKVPPIIIIQGDHGMFHPLSFGGAWMHPSAVALPNSVVSEKMIPRLSILNALYLPGPKHQELPATLSPVNAFRVVLDTYFGAKLGLLPDKSYIPVGGTWANTAKPSTMRLLSKGE